MFPLVTLLAGCPKSPPPAAQKDAGTTAQPPRPPKAFQIDIVARTSKLARMHRAEDGKLFVDTGLWIYEAGPGGALRRLGDPAAYSPFVPALSDDMVGYEATAVRHGRTLRVDGTRVVLQGFEAGKFRAYAWDGRAWISEGVEADPYERTPTIPADAGIVAPPEYDEARALRDGRWVFLRNGPTDLDEAYIVTPNGATVHQPLFESLSDGGALERSSCHFLSAEDGGAYVSCALFARGSYDRSEHVLRLEGDKWVRIDIPASNEPRFGQLAVDTEGALWFAEGTTPLAILRRTRDGAIEKFSLPRAEWSIARPFYGQDTIATESPRRGPDYRLWRVGYIEEAPPADPAYLHEVIPLPNGDVWFAVSEHGSAQLFLRASRDGRAPEPIAIGSPADQVNVLRNERPPREWVGHCPQVFVRLARAKDDASLRVDELLADRAEIEKLAAPLPDRIAETKIVTGTLGGEAVAGVIVMRSFPDAKEAVFEKVVRAIVDRFTTNPAAPPPVFCTLPVLTRAL